MDVLDWTNKWDDYEMYMYVRDDEEDKGIYMQVSERSMQDGAEAWDILYDRKLSELLEGVDGEPGTDDWEENMLKKFLHEHPQLVNDEKAYTAEFVNNR